MRRFIDMTEINLSLFKFFGLLDRTLFFSAFANYGNLQFVPLSDRALFLVTLSRPEVHFHFEGNTKLKNSCQEALRNLSFYVSVLLERQTKTFSNVHLSA